MNLVSTAAGSHRPTHARIIDRFAVDGEEDGRFFSFPKTASHTPLSLSLSARPRLHYYYDGDE